MSAPSVTAQTPRRVNIRTEDGLQRIDVEVISHYQSTLVDRLRRMGNQLTVGNTTVRLAKDFGFCYGVERAIDLAYAARQVFSDRKLYLLGEIIHNPEVNQQLTAMGIVSIPIKKHEEILATLHAEDVVIVPAFGAETRLMNIIKERGCLVVDTTCGDVMNVWKRVRGYAKEGFTSIIHGQATHEETRATASRALGDQGGGHYVVVRTLDDVGYVCDYIRHGGDREGFLRKFEKNLSPGFDPDLHLQRVGVANQTTMLKSETEEIQTTVQRAIQDRDGAELAAKNFKVFDTICGATQERQDALFEMLRRPLDVLLVVGGYNSSNTMHLVEIGEKSLPTFFIRTADCLKSFDEIVHFDLHQKAETTSYSARLTSPEPIIIGVTAGASCPNNLIESTILRVFELRGIDNETAQAAASSPEIFRPDAPALDA